MNFRRCHILLIHGLGIADIQRRMSMAKFGLDKYNYILAKIRDIFEVPGLY